MEGYTNADLKGVDRVKYLLRVFSYKPKLSDRVLDSLPATMLMDLYQILFPKKVEPISPNETVILNSLPPSSTSPAVRSETGAITK